VAVLYKKNKLAYSYDSSGYFFLFVFLTFFDPNRRFILAVDSDDRGGSVVPSES
jgi:hypothetical protein